MRQIKGLTIAVFAILLMASTSVNGQDRPNIVWIVLEDITPMMGCYGDESTFTNIR